MSADDLTGAVLTALRENSDKDGRCFLSIAEMATAAGVSRRTVVTRLKELRARGVVSDAIHTGSSGYFREVSLPLIVAT